MSLQNMARQHGPDAGKLIATVVLWFFTVDWSAVYSFLGCIFVLLMICEKLGLLAGIKARSVRMMERLRLRKRP
jgi:hypothetical protein